MLMTELAHFETSRSRDSMSKINENADASAMTDEKHQVSPTPDCFVASASSSAAEASSHVTSPVTLAEARAAASHMKQLSAHYQNATLASPSEYGRHTPVNGAYSYPQQQYEEHYQQLHPVNYGLWPHGLPHHQPIACTPSRESQTQNNYLYAPPQGHFPLVFSSAQPEATLAPQPVHAMAEQRRYSGRKHRRPSSLGQIVGFHRRMTSNGIMIPHGHHQRENSAGLEILSAAADGMNQEELAAAAGSRDRMHSRDLSLASSAFGSLGSLDFKRLMNSISPQPDVQRQSNLTEVAMSTHPPQQVQFGELKRSTTPPTPMISNVDRYATARSTAKNPPIPDLTSHDVPRRLRESLKPMFVPPEMKKDSPTPSAPPVDNAVESGLKRPTHHLTFSGYLNAMPAPPPHTREPSETSKMLIHLEQKIDQDASHCPPVYDAAPPPSGESRVGQMVFPSSVAVAAALEPPEEQRPVHRMPPAPCYASHAAPASPAPLTASSESVSPTLPRDATKGESTAGDLPLPPVWSGPSFYCMPTAASSAHRDSPNSASVSSGRRTRRKCNIPDCSNRVVQGGLCISHGAKRKQCAHSGCTKNVKKAGLCSAHGPARKKCEYPDCDKVAVQGGKCITHGAKKKLCTVVGCTKQGIINGQCKKHYDDSIGKSPASSTKSSKASSASPKSKRVKVGSGDSDDSTKKESHHGGPSHKRGLSIFHDMKAMEEFIACDETLTSPDTPLLPVNSAQPPRKSGREGEGSAGAAAVTFAGVEPRNPLLNSSSTQLHKRGLSLFSDENVSDAIISGALISGGP